MLVTVTATKGTGHAMPGSPNRRPQPYSDSPMTGKPSHGLGEGCVLGAEEPPRAERSYLRSDLSTRGEALIGGRGNVEAALDFIVGAEALLAALDFIVAAAHLLQRMVLRACLPHQTLSWQASAISFALDPLASAAFCAPCHNRSRAPLRRRAVRVG